MPDAALAPVERIMGIEPTCAAWEAAVLPMNYIRVAALPELHGSSVPNGGERVLTGLAYIRGDTKRGPP